MSRYKWLEDLRAEVRQEKFFLFQAVPAAALAEFEDNHQRLPDDYREFIEKFGITKLFRDPHVGERYEVVVQAPPNYWKEQRGAAMAYAIGGTAFNRVFYLWKDGKWAGNGAVYGYSSQRLASSFQQWIERACRKARRLYSRQEWECVKKPVPPFTEEEERIVEAIPLFRFKQLGVTPDGKLLVEVKNDSQLELPWIGVEVRWPRGIGASAIPTAGIRPGTTKIVEMQNSYAEANAPPDQIELLEQPVPGPADRQYSVLRVFQSKQDSKPIETELPAEQIPIGTERNDLAGLVTQSGLGQWKFVHEIGLNDLLAHPIWLWSMTLGLEDGDDGPEGGDETSMCPFLGSNNVEPEMIQPLILLSVAESDSYASGLYDAELKKVVALRLLNQSTAHHGASTPPWPLTLVAVPEINGVSHLKFRWTTAEMDEANEVRG